MWRDVAAPAAEHGLAALAGTAPHVGAVGYTLGGGLGWLARRYGLNSNRLCAADVVLADGAALRVDEGSEPDLLWALRGGGGNYAIVTALEVELFPHAELYGGNLVFPLARASEVLRGWREWVAGVPDDVTSSIMFLRIPDMPSVPEPMRGQQLTIVSTCCCGDLDAAPDLFAPIQAMGPIMDTLGRMRPTELGALHNDPEDPMPALGGGAVIADLDEVTMGRMMDAVGPDSGTPLLLAEIRHCGGAVRTPPVAGGVCSGFGGEFITYAVGVAPGPAAAGVLAAIDRYVDAQADQITGEGILNFVERHDAAADVFSSETLERLRAIKAARDPDGLITSSHPLGERG